MNQKKIPQHQLIAIAISHYCEKVRWGLDRLGIEYTEENHAPPFHRSYTLPHGGTTVPVLVINNQAFTSSTAILHYLDRISPQKQLYPEPYRQEIEKTEALCDQHLGPATRSWSYYYALQRPKLVLRAWCQEVSPTEKKQCIAMLPQTIEVFRQNFDATEAGTAAALQVIEEVFEVINQKLRLGAKYLIGNSMTAADITFAALASPILRPINHPHYSAKISHLVPEMRSTIEEIRNTPAGKFAGQLYQEQRSMVI